MVEERSAHVEKKTEEYYTRRLAIRKSFPLNSILTPVEHAALILGAVGIAINDAAGGIGAVDASSSLSLAARTGDGREGREG